MHFHFLMHQLEPCYRYYICLGHTRVRDITTGSQRTGGAKPA